MDTALFYHLFPKTVPFVRQYLVKAKKSCSVIQSCGIFLFLFFQVPIFFEESTLGGGTPAVVVSQRAVASDDAMAWDIGTEIGSHNTPHRTRPSRTPCSSRHFPIRQHLPFRDVPYDREDFIGKSHRAIVLYVFLLASLLLPCLLLPSFLSPASPAFSMSRRPVY